MKIASKMGDLFLNKKHDETSNRTSNRTFQLISNLENKLLLSDLINRKPNRIIHILHESTL